MRDPERLLGAGGSADELERELLESVQGADPPAGAKDAAWIGIAGSIAAGAAASVTLASSSSAAAAGKTAAGALLSSSLAAKAVIAVAVSTLAVGGYFAARQAFAPGQGAEPKPRAALATHASKHPVAQPPAAQAEPVIEPAIEPAKPPTAEPKLPTARESSAVHATKREAIVPRASDPLSAESALLTGARAQLRGGDLEAADATLSRLTVQFPHGVLVQEREVLAIELLAARGRAEAAQQRARAFTRAYPHSPHSAKLSRFLERP